MSLSIAATPTDVGSIDEGLTPTTECTTAKAIQPVSPYDSYLKSVAPRAHPPPARRGRTDEEIDALEDRLDRQCSELWRRPVRDFGDLVMLASMACT